MGLEEKSLMCEMEACGEQTAKPLVFQAQVTSDLKV